MALEVESEVRSELRDGEIVEMTGGIPEHNDITGTLIFLLNRFANNEPKLEDLGGSEPQAQTIPRRRHDI